jgi:cytochrome c-type biogenesis protein CcmH
MKRLLLLLAFLPSLALAQMVTRDGVTLTAAQEQRSEAIGDQLRCLVCQNESIEGSSASLAKQLRIIIRQQVIAGADNKTIMNYMVQRYGIFVLLKPPLSRLTLLLYASPFITLLIGFAAAWLARRNRVATPVPLSDSEAARLNKLLNS